MNLARLMGETSLLPSALYECAILPTRQLLMGVVRADGDAPEQLSQDDLERCLEARKHLLHDYFVAALHVVEPVVSTRCATPLECLGHLLDRAEVFKDSQRTGLCRYDALSSRTEEIFSTLEPLCGACVEMVEVRHRAEKWDIWFKLPEYFGMTVADWVSPMASE